MFVGSLSSRSSRPGVPVSWRIFASLFALTIAAYVQRTAVAVAGARMMPELHLTQVQLGWLESAFLISYTAFQFPGAVVGDQWGARRTITACGLLGVGAALALPAAPALFSGAALFVCLLAAQFLLGLSQAPFFALLSGTLERWFPARDWALTQGLSSAGMGLGAAAAPALIATLMVASGWRASLVVAAVPVLVLVAWWWLDGRDTPEQHPDMTLAELARIGERQAAARPTLSDAGRLLLDRNLILLTLGYMAMNVVFYLITFWSFLYLVQARHFTLLEGGFAAAIAPLAGAAGAALGGITVGAGVQRYGDRIGLALTPLISLPLAGGLLLIAVHVDQAWLALCALSLAFGLLEMNEAAFWTASMQIGRREAATAGGVLNTGGNLGGVIATPVVAYLSVHGGWNSPFYLGAGFAVVAAAVWLLIKPTPTAARDGPC